MSWKVEYTRTFLKELARLPKEVQGRAEDIVFNQLSSHNPFALGYVERMKGYPDKYKIRISSYRIGLTIDQQRRVVRCQRVAHRRDIYRIFP